MNNKDKYKEALERAKKELDACGSQDCDAARQIFRLFPELKESEDERIRKFLHHTFTAQYLAKDKLGKWHGEPVTNILTWLEKQGEQKPNDEVEPKFKVGDWIVQKNIGVYRVIEICKSWYEVIDFEDNHYSISFDNEYMCHLWTIQDLKDGDVLYYKSPLTDIEYIVMSSGVNEYGNIDSHFRYKSDDWFGVNVNSVFNAHLNNITLANKKQRNILFKKMKEAGYEWDAEKKELKKIEQNSTWNEEECDINGLCAAIDILQKTLGKVEGYQSDDGILEHERAISALKQFAEKNPAWNEKDENIIDVLKNAIKEAEQTNPKIYNKELCNLLFIWLKSLKNRIFQPHWKPSEEQLEALWNAIPNIPNSEKDIDTVTELSSLYEELKKL